jgi:site-specific DNA-methyltransferase (adenine-specific)
VTFNTYNRFGVNERDAKQGSLNYQDREDVWVINREYKPGRVKNKNELPEALLNKIIRYSSNPGDVIADFFLGGFSTARCALSLGRRICGFEVNANSFNLYNAGLKEIIPGTNLTSQRKVDKTLPENQRKRWTKSEMERLRVRFNELEKKTITKRQLISELQKEFGRGYFSILNKISEISNP